MPELRVLQFCNEDFGTARQRTQAFKRLNSNNKVLFHSLLHKKFALPNKIFRSVFHRLHLPLQQTNENSKLLKFLESNFFDILFVEKCLTLRHKTLKTIKLKYPNLKIVCYTLDDCKGQGNQSIHFTKCIPYYDLIATNKKHNIEYYKRKKAQKVYYFKNAFSKDVHKPTIVSKTEQDKFGSDITFIGHYEQSRRDYIVFLANNGCSIKIWGWGEDSSKTGIIHPNIINTNQHIYFNDFAKAISASNICLNFLRKANKDTETTRTFEIPACKGLMIAERTPEQLEMFEENKEAVYFETKEELLEKVKYYLTHATERNSIAENGYKKCLRADYSYDNQLINILNNFSVK